MALEGLHSPPPGLGGFEPACGADEESDPSTGLPSSVPSAGCSSDEESEAAKARSELASESSDTESCADSCCSEEEPVPARFTREDSILIFDWDDTLLPSTWLVEHGLNLQEHSQPSEDEREQLNQIAIRARMTLEAAQLLGEVVLVTNAERGWIELSCQKFMPSLYASLEGLKLISARSTYEELGISSPSEWKFLAFESEINEFYTLFPPERRRNIISLGDSRHEREALIRVAETMLNCCTKSIKFVEQPEVGQLIKQHDLLLSSLGQLLQHDGNLDLCLRCM